MYNYHVHLFYVLIGVHSREKMVEFILSLQVGLQTKGVMHKLSQAIVYNYVPDKVHFTNRKGWSHNWTLNLVLIV